MVQTLVQIDLKTWMQSGIFSIRYVETGKVYLCGSLCMLEALVRLIKNIEIDKIEVSILETPYSRIRLQHYIETTPNCLNKRASVKYKVDMELYGKKVHVVLKSRNNTKIVVGIFRKMHEANSFVQQHYKDGVKHIVYANNLLTRAWRRGEVDA